MFPSRLVHRATWLLTAALAVGGTATLLAQQSGLREPAPGEAAQALAIKHLHERYKDEYAKAQTDPTARADLAARLLEASRQPKSTANERFVLLREARDLAARAFDLVNAFQAAEEMARRFAVSPAEMKAAALTAAAPAATTAEANQSLAEHALGVMQEAVDADAFETAVRLGKLAADAAGKSKNQQLVENISGRNREVHAMRQTFAAMRSVLDRLAQDPEDAAANLAMGRYQGLAKGNWDRALFYLAQGSDPVLRRLAQRDLARPDDSKEQLQIAEAWWTLAEKEKAGAQVHLQQRAVFWYEQAIDHTRGFQRGRLEQRIATVPRPFAPSAGWDFNGRPGEIRTLNGHNSIVYGVAFSPDGKKALSGSVDGRAVLWETATGRQLHQLQGHGGMIWGVAYDPRGKHLFTSSWDGTVKMWDAARGLEVRRFPAQGRIADINGVAVSPNGKQMLTGSDDGTVRLWDVETGHELRQFTGHRGFVYGVAFSPDGKRALSGGSADNQMILWDLATGKEIRRFNSLQGQLRMVAFTPDGQKAVHSGGNSVRLLHLPTGQVIRQFQGQGEIYAVAFSPDGRRLAIAGADRTIRLWDVATGREIHRFDGHTNGVFALAFSPGGGRLLSGGQDNSVRLWGLPR
jgi:hypothetical protein